MIRSIFKRNFVFAKGAFCPLSLSCTMAIALGTVAPVTLIPTSGFAQSLNLTLSPLSEMQGLEKNWQNKRDTLNEAIKAKQEHAIVSDRVSGDSAKQQEKINGAKSGLGAAVLKVAEAKNRLSQVDTSDVDPKGDDLSQALIKSQQELNLVISSAKEAEETIAGLKAEHEKLRSTVAQLKNAVAAARAAVSAADVYVEAVKSAQAALASGNSDSAQPSNLENDFFNDAVIQAQSAQKSSEVAQQALTLTQERQTKIAQDLLNTEELQGQIKDAEAESYKKFAAADEAFKKHQAIKKAEKEKRDTLIADINAELDVAQEQLNAQKEILQAETLAMQELSGLQQSAAEIMAGLDKTVAAAQYEYDKSLSQLRAAQNTRAAQTAAILATLNSDMHTTMRVATPGADTDGPTSRLILPVQELFSKNSAKLRKTDTIKLSELAAIAKATVARAPEGLDWILRVDSYTTGDTDESWFLSQNRALSIAKILIGNGKFDTSKVSANSIAKAVASSDASKGGWVELILSAR